MPMLSSRPERNAALLADISNAPLMARELTNIRTNKVRVRNLKGAEIVPLLLIHHSLRQPLPL